MTLTNPAASTASPPATRPPTQTVAGSRSTSVPSLAKPDKLFAIVLPAASSRRQKPTRPSSRLRGTQPATPLMTAASAHGSGSTTTSVRRAHAHTSEANSATVTTPMCLEGRKQPRVGEQGRAIEVGRLDGVADRDADGQPGYHQVCLGDERDARAQREADAGAHRGDR